MKEKNIFPLDGSQMIFRPEKEKFLNQKAKIIWFTGLSGSGKSTLASALEKKLFQKGFLTQILDGDNIRVGINNNLTFTKEDRTENIRRVSEVSKLLINCGVICINSFITPREKMRDLARNIIGKSDYIEIYVNAPLNVCEQRDVKGLYKKARKGEIKNFTGISAPFETPEHADFEINTDQLSIDESIEKLFNFLLPKITL